MKATYIVLGIIAVINIVFVLWACAYGRKVNKRTQYWIDKLEREKRDGK